MGLNQYPGCKLDWCDNDAIAIRELIETNGDGSPNFDTMQIIVSCGAVYLKRSIKELFSGDSDIAFLCFSGHGADRDGGYLSFVAIGIDGVSYIDYAIYSINERRFVRCEFLSRRRRK